MKTNFNILNYLPALGATIILSSCASTGPAQVDADASAIMRGMSDRMAAAKTLSFKATRTVDAGFDEGINQRSTSGATVNMQRPNKLFSRSAGGAADKVELYYDGANLSLHSPRSSVYATVSVPNTVDAMMDYIEYELGFTPNFADFLSSNPYQSMLGSVTSGRIVGSKTIRGHDCHQLAFTQADADWQVWVGKDDHLPWKVHVTYKDGGKTPSLTGDFTSWKLNSAMSGRMFQFTPPKGTQKIEMIPEKH